MVEHQLVTIETLYITGTYAYVAITSSLDGAYSSRYKLIALRHEAIICFNIVIISSSAKFSTLLLELITLNSFPNHLATVRLCNYYAIVLVT